VVKAEKVFRLTFSKSLAEHIVAALGDDTFTLRRLSFRIGRRLELGDLSRSGAYAVVDVRKGATLRVSLDRDVAELMRSDSRYLAEAWVVQ
jgi:hypothetical protein